MSRGFLNMLTGAYRLMRQDKGRFDGHAHVFRSDLPMVENRRYTPEYHAEMEQYIGHLRTNDLDGALLVQPSFLGTDNSYLLSVLANTAQSKGLIFRGTAVLEPDTTEAQLMELHKSGIVGLRLNLVGQSDSFQPDAWIPLLRRIDRLGWHLEIHCEGVNLAGVLESVLPYCQTVVVDHFGLPTQSNVANCPGQQAILAAPKQQIMVKTSAPYRVFPEIGSQQAAVQCNEIFKRLYEHLGSDALLWGSDWPWTRFETEHGFSEVVQWEQDWIASTEVPNSS